MRKGEALPGKYLGQEDFHQPILVDIEKVVIEPVQNTKTGEWEPKPVLYATNPSDEKLDTKRGIILNSGNWDVCESLGNEPDSDNWKGLSVVIFQDPTVTFGKETTGGIRFRVPNVPAAPNKPAEEEPPPPMPDDVPF